MVYAISQRFPNWGIMMPQLVKPCLCPFKGLSGGEGSNTIAKIVPLLGAKHFLSYLRGDSTSCCRPFCSVPQASKLLKIGVFFFKKAGFAMKTRSSIKKKTIFNSMKS